jgi:hypothetical protein
MDRDPDEIYRELTPECGPPQGYPHSVAAICFSDRWEPAPDATTNRSLWAPVSPPPWLTSPGRREVAHHPHRRGGSDGQLWLAGVFCAENVP